MSLKSFSEDAMELKNRKSILDYLSKSQENLDSLPIFCSMETLFKLFNDLYTVYLPNLSLCLSLIETKLILLILVYQI